MKLGFITAALANMPFETVLIWLKEKGINTIELAVRMSSETPHINAESLLNSESEARDFLSLLERYNIEISALSCHGNPIHPQKAIAQEAHQVFEKTVLLAQKLGIARVITFSGCPGDCKTSQYPNWVTCSWPNEYLNVLEYQWNDVLIPYWKNAAEFSVDHSVNKICIEMHPGFCVYNPETLLRLREAVGEPMGANFDPSHLFWQSIDPVMAIKELGEAIYHVHAKDVKIDRQNTAINGILDTKHYGRERERAWIFRTVGYGHDAQTWKDMIGALRMTGYDDVLSIEHEDSLMSVDEGASKAIAFLKDIVIDRPSDGIWWA